GPGPATAESRPMPILARCPNPACGQTLSVPDQYAGQQGPCPRCGTSVLFAAPAAAAAAPPPPTHAGQPGPWRDSPPPPPPPDAPSRAVAAGGVYPPAAGMPPPRPAGPPLSTQELVSLIALPAGLFFLFLLVLSSFLPWVGSGPISASGTRLGDAG